MLHLLGTPHSHPPTQLHIVTYSFVPLARLLRPRRGVSISLLTLHFLVLSFVLRCCGLLPRRLDKGEEKGEGRKERMKRDI